MNFVSPLQRGILLARYKRFLADIELDDGRRITAHCPNPGAMLGLNMPGLPVWVSVSPNPKRKLAHTLELVEADGGLVGVNTMHPNRIVAEALAADAIAELSGYEARRREVRYGVASRIDFLLEGSGPSHLTGGSDRPEVRIAPHQRAWLEVNNVQPFYNVDAPRLWLEVKNCHLSRERGLAEFPDCVAARSTRHVRELESMVAAGDRAAVLFVVQRTDCDRFSPAADCDPAFAKALGQAVANGVELYVHACDITTAGIRLSERLTAVL